MIFNQKNYVLESWFVVFSSELCLQIHPYNWYPYKNITNITVGIIEAKTGVTKFDVFVKNFFVTDGVVTGVVTVAGDKVDVEVLKPDASPYCLIARIIW